MLVVLCLLNAAFPTHSLGPHRCETALFTPLSPSSVQSRRVELRYPFVDTTPLTNRSVQTCNSNPSPRQFPSTFFVRDSLFTTPPAGWLRGTLFGSGGRQHYAAKDAPRNKDTTHCMTAPCKSMTKRQSSISHKETLSW